ncbi:hypothetical protein [Hymenobacter lapidiphilus]|uniref:Uncharacterized protein n=1 Tax=Hymenobacter lapidiphilus TaxID=2608003 RepID=A0A7Y7PLE4_9BACT|nr:hypothetical protein [Hymenobacter lapidiphilus]NVO29974.1 hypothetical protein [Hymenobacter lapidiphilus]
MRPAASYAAQLWQFVWQLLLPAVPRLAWCVLALLIFSGLNLLFQRELWPHYPQAEKWFIVLLLVGLALIPWMGIYTAQRLTHQVRHWWWRGFWQLVIVGSYALATVSSFILLLGLLMSLAR